MYKDYEIIRDKRGYTDYKVSKETGVHTSTLTEWKKGTYRPKLETLVKISRCLNTQVEFLVPELYETTDTN